MAANVLAAEMSIDVHRFLKKNEDELKELRTLIAATPQAPKEETKMKKQDKEQLIIINKKIIDAFDLPQNLSREANRMAEIYPDMYVLENLVRYVVMDVLDKKFGNNWWKEPNVVSRKIMDKVGERKNEEGKNRWHSERGSHEIFYTDFGDLSSIISTNWNHFEPIFPSLRWIQSRLEETELSRNIIAHNNPLPTKEFDRIKLCLDDLRKQLDTCIQNAG